MQIKLSFRLQKWFDSNVPSLDDSLKKSDNEKRPKICLTKSFLVVAVTNVTINQCDKYKNVDCRILICHHWILKIMIIFVFNKANEMISQRNVTAPKSQSSTIKITLLVNELNHFYCCFYVILSVSCFGHNHFALYSREKYFGTSSETAISLLQNKTWYLLHPNNFKK